jgi:hypothetical protein
MCTGSVVMDLDRGTLARIDRKVVAGLAHNEVYRTVRVSATEATWSTWKRYCDAAGVSMGQAIMALISNELRAVVDEPVGDGGPVFAGLTEQKLHSREAQLAVREHAVDETKERLSEWTKRLRAREDELRRLERQLQDASAPVVRPAEPRSKVGRNERCPCRSGLKYKHCHGLAGRE